MIDGLLLTVWVIKDDALDRIKLLEEGSKRSNSRSTNDVVCVREGRQQLSDDIELHKRTLQTQSEQEQARGRKGREEGREEDLIGGMLGSTSNKVACNVAGAWVWRLLQQPHELGGRRTRGHGGDPEKEARCRVQKVGHLDVEGRRKLKLCHCRPLRCFCRAWTWVRGEGPANNKEGSATKSVLHGGRLYSSPGPTK